MTSLNDGAGLNAGSGLDNDAQLDRQAFDPDPVNDAARYRFGDVDQVPGTDTNPVYRYRDGQAALYRVPADGDQTGAVRLLLDQGYLK